MISYPVVPHEQTAIAIFRAVAGEYQSSEEAAQLEIIAQRDPNDPETWIVFQQTPIRQAGGHLIVSIGGGFEMKIDRCAGAVRDFHGQK